MSSQGAAYLRTMATASFDFEVFPIVVASQLLGLSHVQDQFISNDASKEIHWYWRSPSSDTQCIWIDSSWEIQRGKTVWKLGALSKSATGGGVYVQSDALQESDFQQFFFNSFSIVLESSTTNVSAKIFARALQQFPNSTSHTDASSIRLYFSDPDLEMAATFPLATDTAGTRTEVNPVLLSRLQYTCPPVAAPMSSLSDEELVAMNEMFQAWKSHVRSPEKQKILSPPLSAEKRGSEVLEPSVDSKKRKPKRPAVHGMAKIPSTTRRKPALKFKGQG